MTSGNSSYTHIHSLFSLYVRFRAELTYIHNNKCPTAGIAVCLYDFQDGGLHELLRASKASNIKLNYTRNRNFITKKCL